jgi:hypothetical protein
MTNKPFQNFVAEFNKLATKSGKTASQKVEALKVKVSQELADVSTNRSAKPRPDGFEGWCIYYRKYIKTCRKRSTWISFATTDQVPAVPSPCL